MADEGTKRAYLILEEAEREDGTMPTYHLRGEVDASGSEQAIRGWAKDQLHPVAGVFVAVTKRSWFTATVKTETQTRLVIE